MKHRSLVAVILFSIITFGIYDLYWLVSTKKVLNQRTKVHVPTIWILFLPILIMVLALGFVMATAQSGSGGTAVIAVVIEIVAIFAIIPITFYWFFKYSKAVSEFTGGRMNTAVTFLLLWLIRFIGIAIIQDEFNGMVDGTAPQPVAAASLAPVADQSMPPVATAAPAEPQPRMAAFMTDVTPPAPQAPAPVDTTYAATTEVPAAPVEAPAPQAPAPVDTTYAATTEVPAAPVEAPAPLSPVQEPVAELPEAPVEAPVAEAVAPAPEIVPQPEVPAEPVPAPEPEAPVEPVAAPAPEVATPAVDPDAPVIITPTVAPAAEDEATTPPVTPWQPPTNPTA